MTAAWLREILLDAHTSIDLAMRAATRAVDADVDADRLRPVLDAIVRQVMPMLCEGMDTDINAVLPLPPGAAASYLEDDTPTFGELGLELRELDPITTDTARAACCPLDLLQRYAEPVDTAQLAAHHASLACEMLAWSAPSYVGLGAAHAAMSMLHALQARPDRERQIREILLAAYESAATAPPLVLPGLRPAVIDDILDVVTTWWGARREVGGFAGMVAALLERADVEHVGIDAIAAAIRIVLGQLPDAELARVAEQAIEERANLKESTPDDDRTPAWQRRVWGEIDKEQGQ